MRMQANRIVCRMAAGVAMVVMAAVSAHAGLNDVYWSPTNLTSSMSLWLDGSDTNTLWADTNGTSQATTTVARWDDKSGNGHHLTQGTAFATGYSQNGRNTLRSAGKWMSNTNFAFSASGDVVVFVVSEIESSNSNFDGMFAAKGTAGDFGLSSGTAGTWNGNLAISGLGIGKALTGGPYTNTGYRVFNVNMNFGASTADAYVDGVIRTSGGTYTTKLDTPGAFHLSRNASGSKQFTGKFAEVIVCDDVTTETRQKVEGYLAWRWGIEAKLPTDHPYRYSAPDAPIPFRALSVSNITTTSAELYAYAETNLNSATVVWDTSDMGTTNITDWTGTRSITMDSTPGQITGTATGLTEDTWYYFRFYGEDVTTNGWSSAQTFPTDITANQTPQFSSAYPSSSKVYLYWSDNANTEQAYILQRATSSGGPYSDLVTLATDTTTYADTTVSAGTTYYYRLLATNNISMTATDPSACQISTTTLTAGPIVTISATTPTTNEADVAVLSGATDATGDKCWTDTGGHGQTFMSSSKGGKLKAITYQSKMTNTASRTYGVRVGKMSGSTFNGIYWDSGNQTNSMPVVDMYMTVTFPTPIDLEPATLYGVDVQMDSSVAASGTGIPYFHYIKSNIYADGMRYTMVRGNPSTVTLSTTYDRIFHLDIDLPPPAGTLISFR
jgi:hypothetical protein